MVRTFRVFASVSTAHRARAADLGADPSIPDQKHWALTGQSTGNGA
jgi:hypothetical protein